jgi:hypothetical protein
MTRPEDQLWFQRWVSRPSPIRLITPCFSIFFPSTRDSETCDGWIPSLDSGKSTSGEYTKGKFLALSTSMSWRIREAWRYRSARLNSSMSRNLNPSSNLGLVISSQETQAIFLFPSLLSHQKLLICAWICLHTPRSSLKRDIKYVGIAWPTDFSKIYFPSAESICSVLLGSSSRPYPLDIWRIFLSICQHQRVYPSTIHSEILFGH